MDKEQPDSNARCDLPGCEFDRGMLSSAYEEFDTIIDLLNQHTQLMQSDEDFIAHLRDVRRHIDDVVDRIIALGWVV